MVLKNLSIGQMRSSVTFLVNNPTTSATVDREVVTTGGQNDVYGTLLTTRGRLRKKNGNRGLDLGLAEIKESYELVCRFQSSLESSLRSDVKIVIGNKLFTIASWEKVDEIDRFYKFELNATSDIVSDSYPVGTPISILTDVIGEEITGGTSVTLTLQHSAVDGTLQLYKNGVRLADSEFSYSGTTITLISNPEATDIFTADYKYQS